MTRTLTAILAFAAVLGLAACDGGPASKPSRDQAASGGGSSTSGDRATTDGDSRTAANDRSDAPLPKTDPRTEPAPMLDGKPLWAASRRRSAQDAVERQFARNGEAFGARSVEDYARKARAFVENPPAGAETISRGYGKIIYDPKSNTFAAATKDGVPRAMFKPDDGPAYWEKQKAGGDRSGGSRRRDGGGDQG